MGFLADKCTFRLLTRELIATCKPFFVGMMTLTNISWRILPFGQTRCTARLIALY